MGGYGSTMWSADPVRNPEAIPLGEWWRVKLVLVATCKGCGREREVPTGVLLQHYSQGQYFTEQHRAELSRKLRCVSCDRRAPDLVFRTRQE